MSLAARNLSLFRRFVVSSFFLLASLLPATAALPRVLIDFAAVPPTRWTPYQKATLPRAAANGHLWALPFDSASSSTNRNACDYRLPAPLNLDAAPQFALDFTLTQPGAVRHVGLCFRSGNGWYVCNKPPTSQRRQELLFAKSDFSVEGKPTGWHAIDGIRVSPWKGYASARADFTLHRLLTYEGNDLWLVRGTTSCPDAGTRSVSSQTTALLSRFLAESGVAHRILDDDALATALSRAAMKGPHAILLPYNPHPPAAELAALRSHLARGGRLGVFYSASPELAAAMQFSLGPYQREPAPDRWRIIVPRPGALPGAPARAEQHSSSLMAAVPASSQAFILADWRTLDGSPVPEPAIVASPAGFWMSHVVQPDDFSNKRQLVLALCARLDPALLDGIAARAAATAPVFPPFSSVAETAAGLERQFRARPADAAALRPLAERALGLSSAVAQALRNGDPAAAWRLANAQRAQLLLSYLRSLPPGPPGERIAVWDHSGAGIAPGRWPETARKLRELGITDVFANLAWGGLAHYPSRVVPPSSLATRNGDQLEAARRATAANNLRLHAWVVLWKLDGAPADFVERMKKEGRLQVSSDGKTTLPWLSPHHPKNRQLMKDLIAEIVTRSPSIDGIHLDYIRLPNAQSCYSATTRERFEAASRKKVARWPADVLPGGVRCDEFRRWRAKDITDFLDDVRTRLRRIAPKVQLSAAVYATVPDSPDGGSVAQNWPEWLRRDLVDFVTPMDYTESDVDFERLLRLQLALPNSKGKIIPGIGVAATESRLDAAQTAAQLLVARRLGCPGAAFFALSPSLISDVLPALRPGPLRPAP